MPLGGNEYCNAATDVKFTVRRAGKVIDERRIIDDTEVDPSVAKLIEDLLNNPTDNPVATAFVNTLIELIEKEEGINAKHIKD